MALSHVEGIDGLFVGGLWALRRSDTLKELSITHILSLTSFDQKTLKNFKQEAWEVYGKEFSHLVIDVMDIEDSDLLIEMPRIVRFIRKALPLQPQQRANNTPSGHANITKDRPGRTNSEPSESDSSADESDSNDDENTNGGSFAKNMKELKLSPSSGKGGVFVHCAAGISRSVTAVIAYLLHTYPSRFDPAVLNASSPLYAQQSRRNSAQQAVQNALDLVRRTRPMANPNSGFIEQLHLWWEMGCPVDHTTHGGTPAKSETTRDDPDFNPVEQHPIYQKWSYNNEVNLHTAVGMVPPHLRFSDEHQTDSSSSAQGSLLLKCKKCRRLLASSAFLLDHQPRRESKQCQHHFVEPLSWMKEELKKGEMSGRLTCPNAKCGAGLGRYDWKGFGCSCGEWVVPGFSLQKARVDESISGVAAGIRMPPGMGKGNL